MATIKEVPTKAGRFERIGAHTHVKGLGLDEEMKAIKVKEEWSVKKRSSPTFLGADPRL